MNINIPMPMRVYASDSRESDIAREDARAAGELRERIADEIVRLRAELDHVEGRVN